MTTSRRSGVFGRERQRPGRVARLQHTGGVRPQLLSEKGGESFADDGELIVDDEQLVIWLFSIEQPTAARQEVVRPS